MASGRIPSIEGGIQPTIVDAKGDLIAATAADTPARIAVGANDTVLTADSSTATGLKWAAPAAGGMTLISTTTLTGASVTLSSIPGTFNNLQLVIRDFLPANGSESLRMRINGISVASYDAFPTNSGSNNGTVGTFAGTNFTVSFSTSNSVTENLSIINLNDYANTVTWKMVEFTSITVDPSITTSYAVKNGLALFNQTGAITSLDLFPSAGNFTSGTALLYGVK